MFRFRLPKLRSSAASMEPSREPSCRAGRGIKKIKSLSQYFRSLGDFGSFLGSRTRFKAKDCGVLKWRSLRAEPLEERALLSVTPASWQDTLVTQNLNASQVTSANQSVASDHNGDFVVVWTQNDSVTDPSTGQTIIDPVTGQPKSDENIYARYYTDNVQRVYLPGAVLNNVNPPTPGVNGKFSLDWGGNEVQQISITATAAPFTGSQPNIVGNFTLGFDLNGDGVIEDNEKTTIAYNENAFQAADPAQRPQSILQAQLRSLGGPLADCTVDAVSPHEYLVNFGNASQGQKQPLITVVDQSFTSGFYPAVQVSAVRVPTILANIQVSPTNPWATATQIQNAFVKTTQGYFTAPVFVQPPPYGLTGPAPYSTPLAPRYPTPQVSVVPVLGLPGFADGTVFDITFTGASADQDQPEMQISAVSDYLGNDLTAQLASLPGNGHGVKTLKGPSPEFRVNPPEPPDPLTGEPNPYDQRNPAVAMDADGQFVITWEGDVPDPARPSGINTEIFARRFEPQAWVPDSQVSFVQGVLPLGGQFQVNSTDINPSRTPTVAMDANGDFVIAWANIGQELSYFNTVDFQRYNRDGERIGSETQVTPDATAVNYEPAVGMSPDGHFAVAWVTTTDPNYFLGNGYFANVSANIYDPNGVQLAGPLPAPGAANPNVAFDGGNNVIISGEALAADDIGSSNIDTWATEWGFNAQTNSYSVVRPQFRINGAGQAGSALANSPWPHSQGGTQLGLDLDGDLTATYTGFGPDMSENLFIPGSYFQGQINATTNADLLAFFNPATDNLTPLDALGGQTGDIDAIIENVLISAVDKGATPSQVGRLRAILDSVAGLLRGEANGVMFSQWDASPQLQGSLTTLNSDSVVNAQRDGRNTRILLTFNASVTAGSFVIRLYGGGVPGYEDITISPVFVTVNSVTYLDIEQTRLAIQNALLGAKRVGVNWPQPNLGYSGPITVRTFSYPFANSEFTSRQGTPWQLTGPGLLAPGTGNTDVVYEITFQGEAHDTSYGFFPLTNSLQIGSTPAPSPQVLTETVASSGTTQYNASMGIQPNGSFVVAWTQAEEYTNGSVAGNNIYYRNFTETTDTAGPQVTDFALSDGQLLTDGAQVTQSVGQIVVTFDEDMERGGPGDLSNITDPSNWALIRDGVNVQGAIKKIQFGMNMAQDLGLVSVGSNKWEAVITFDASGTAGQNLPLGDGQYQLVALNTLRDRNGNVLGRSGYNPNGLSFSRQFDILVPASATETRVNPDPTGNQRTYPNDPKAVASDAEGDYVVVYTSDAAGSQGVYAQMYTVSWTNDPQQGRVSSYTAQTPILVTSDPTAVNPSVASDPLGDFVVTWSQEDLDASGNKTDWNVYARRYTHAGIDLTLPWRVNTYTAGIQRDSAVAMDPEGDFAVTWQSLGEDGSGYGIYAQRYNPAGSPIGGMNDVQLLTLTGNLTFLLDLPQSPPLSNLVTPPISYTGNIVATAADIQAKLQALGLSVSVVARDRTSILITLTGKDGSQPQPQLQVVGVTSTDPTASAAVSTLIEGTNGEFRVNDTTAGDQEFPSIAMAADGTFVISWTSWGQDGDLPYQSNVYAKKFISNEALQGSQKVRETATANPNYLYEKLMTTVDDPSNHVLSPGSGGYDGVAELIMDRTDGVFLGTGTLLNTPTRTYILTAAHNVADDQGNLVATRVTATFTTTAGTVSIDSSQIYVNPQYDGSPWDGGHDLAIIVLSQPVPAGIPAYDIYRGTVPQYAVFTKVGYGKSGTGATGDTLDAGTKRSGENSYDTTSAIFGSYPDGLAYDFDDGTAAHDAFGVLFGVTGPNDLGLGNNEICGAPGDSGGPNFINGQIAGVTSYGIALPGPQDVSTGLPEPDSSFGDMGVDVNVSQYASWIDSVTLGGSSEFRVNDFTAGNQMWSSIAMDLKGDFVVTWTSYGEDGVGNGAGPGVNGMNGVFAKRYDNQAQAQGTEFQVNTFAAGNQQYPSVAMDANGDFVVAWESFQDRPDPTVNNSNTNPDAPNSYGIYAQRYRASVAAGGTPNGEIGGEMHISTTTAGDQRYPSEAMDDEGDFMIVWSGEGDVPGQSDPQGVFAQRFDALQDNAGPIVADVLNVGQTPSGGPGLQLVRDQEMLTGTVTQFVVEFSEDLTSDSASDVHSITNPANWQIFDNGVPLTGGVASIQYGKSEAYALGLESNPSGTFQAVITFDSDSTKAGNQPLGAGQYTLTISDAVQDLFGNPLDGNYDGVPGADFLRTFSIGAPNTGTTSLPGNPNPNNPNQKDIAVDQSPLGQNDSPAVATDAAGDYVAVWVAYGQDGDPPGVGNIVGQRFDHAGNKLGSQFIINTHFAGSQLAPDVAMDPLGDFVVVWSGEGQDGQNGPIDSQGIFYRRFDSTGAPLDAYEHEVNTYVPNAQYEPAVAMDALGNFVVTWSGEGLDGAGVFDDHGIWARRFSALGQALDTSQVLVNSVANKAYAQEASDVAMDASGNYFLVWRSQGQDAGAWGVYGQRFNADGSRNGGEIHLNQNVYGAKINPKVAMDAAGNSIVVWAGIRSDGFSTHVYQRRFAASGAALDGGRESPVDDDKAWDIANNVVSTTAFLKQEANVTTSGNNFVVTWSSYDQDQLNQSPPAASDGVFAHLFNADGSQFLDPKTLLPLGDFRVNATTAGDQNNPDVAMDPNGDFAAVWVGPDADSTGVWTRLMSVDPTSSTTTNPTSIRSDGWSGGWSDGTQYGNANLVSAAPGQPTLLAVTDSGSNSSDGLTNFDNSTPTKALQFQVPGTVAGSTVTIYAGGTAIGSAIATGTTTAVITNGQFPLASKVWSITARQTEPGESQSPDSPPLSITIDTVAPTVTLGLAATQPASAQALPVHFAVVFSKAVTGFTASDVTLSGTAPGESVVAVTGSGTTYDVEATATGSGTIVATIAAGAVQDAAGNPNVASTNASVTYQPLTALTETIDQAASQADPTDGSPVSFTVVFNRPVKDFKAADVALAGSALPTAKVVRSLGDGKTYTVLVSGMSRAGTVIATVLGGKVHDLNGVANAASTGTDNVVVYNHPVKQYEFATSASPVVAGWTKVTDKTRYSPGKYGWVAGSGTVFSRTTGAGTGIQRAEDYTQDATFDVALPNGTYLVTAYVGDPAKVRDRMVLTVNGQASPELNTNMQVIPWTTSVTVTGGQLSVRLQDLGGTDPYASIEGLKIDSAYVGPQVSSSSIAPAGSSTNQTLAAAPMAILAGPAPAAATTGPAAAGDTASLVRTDAVKGQVDPGLLSVLAHSDPHGNKSSRSARPGASGRSNQRTHATWDAALLAVLNELPALKGIQTLPEIRR